MRKRRAPDPEDAAYARLRAAGYDTESVGPLAGYRVRAVRGGWASDWYPTARDLARALLDAQTEAF